MISHLILPHDHWNDDDDDDDDDDEEVDDDDDSSDKNECGVVVAVSALTVTPSGCNLSIYFIQLFLHDHHHDDHGHDDDDHHHNDHDEENDDNQIR